ncbi:MAG TPA: fructosamine kinase family protein [Jatrophihabitantaceae bacterium]|nr:fructosamine kinase family protein [Jatrophihabitantaceae bacterium]
MSATFRKHDAHVPDDFFVVEAAGLDWLRQANAVAVPRVVSVGRDHIELERIEHGSWTRAADERFGRELAVLHRTGAPSFGGENRAYIGPLPMPNEPASDWSAFYGTQRIEPFLRGVPPALRSPIEHVLSRIDELAGPPEPPARIHGDLWRGNVLADRSETPWLIDPAAHGGHRETDLAMMRLFGGFGEVCFAAYDEVFPLNDGWRDRIALHQLHPLLVHCVLFGGSYVEQALAVARRYK